MSEPRCAVSGCPVTIPHEHRGQSWNIKTGARWCEMTEYDQRLLNEARSLRGLAQLVFAPAQPDTEPLVFETDPERGGVVHVPRLEVPDTPQ